jgi:WD40 repeat protein
MDLNPVMSELVAGNVVVRGEVKFFDARSLQPIRGLPGPGVGDGISNDSYLTYSPDGTTAAHVSSATVSMWDATSMRPVWSHPDSLATVSFSPDSRFIAVGGYRSTTPGHGVESLGGALKIYDATTGNLVLEHHVEKDEYGSESVPALAYSPDGRWLVVTVSAVENTIFWSRYPTPA